MNVGLAGVIGAIGAFLLQRWLLILAVCLLLCAVGGLTAFLLSRSGRGKDAPFVTLDEEVHRGGGQPAQMRQMGPGQQPGTAGHPGAAGYPGATEQQVRWMSDEMLEPISRRIQEYPETDLKSYQLTLQDLDRPGKAYQANVAERVTIGRKSGCTIQIPDRTLSGEHCEVLLRDGKLYVHDLQSTNGTYLNRGADRVDKAELKSGDILRLGSARLRVRISVISS